MCSRVSFSDVVMELASVKAEGGEGGREGGEGRVRQCIISQDPGTILSPSEGKRKERQDNTLYIYIGLQYVQCPLPFPLPFLLPRT